MSLFFAELRKVWGGRVFPVLLAILASANLLLLWMGTRPTANQPPAAAYRAVGAELTGKTMEEKGTYLREKCEEIESLVKIGQYYRELAYGDYGLTQYRQDNAAMFDAYEQEYKDRSYTLFTDNLNTEYRLFSQLQNEYNTVAGYGDFLQSVQTKANQLSGISIFQNDRTGYDLKNIELTAQVYAGLTETPIDYFPQKGLYTAISYAFTDLILPDFAGIYALAGADPCAAGARQRTAEPCAQPAGRTVKNSPCQAGGICCQLIGRSYGAVRGQPCLLLGVLRFRLAASYHSKCSRPDALHHADHRRAIPASVFAGQVDRGVRDGPLGHAGRADRAPRRRGLDRRVGAAVGDVRRARGYSGHEPPQRG